jgi:hypothetical protein
MPASRVALLDVNVLVALFFPNHVHHDLAHDWFAEHRTHGWATCPITENGFVRVACQQPGDDGPIRPQAAVEHLARFCQSGHHHRWADDVSLIDAKLFVPKFIRGHAQVTDVFLLGLAQHHRGCLATFDRTIPIVAVKGAALDALRVIAPAD